MRNYIGMRKGPMLLASEFEGIVALAKQGDSAALAQLYEANRDRIFRFLYYRVGNHQAAEDLTTEVFLRVIQSIKRYRSRQPFQAWLFRIARNLAIDHHRRQTHRNHESIDDGFATGAPSPETAANQALTSARLQWALARLTANQRDVIILRFVNDMRIAEVAETLSKSESAVKSLQSRGLERLQQLLAPEREQYG